MGSGMFMASPPAVNTTTSPTAQTLPMAVGEQPEMGLEHPMPQFQPTKASLAAKDLPNSSQATANSLSSQKRLMDSVDLGVCTLKQKTPTDCRLNGTGVPFAPGPIMGAISEALILSLGLFETLSRVLCTKVDEVDVSSTKGGSSEVGSPYGSDL